MPCLEGKVVVVTGAGRGIGRAEAHLFAREGARLVVNDLGCGPEGQGDDPSVIQSLGRELRAAGAEVVADATDVAADGASERLVGRAVEAFGRLDAVVANAGLRRDRGLLKMADEDLQRLLDVHVGASFGLTRAAAKRFVEQREGGAVVLTTSPLAFFGSARQSGLAAANAAITGLARSAAVELRRHGVRVNAIAPTAHTRLTEDLPLFQRIGAESMSAQHVAPVAAFLASELAADVYGEVVGVAGSRVYSFRCREGTGAFVEGRPFTPQELRDAWPDIIRSG